jgi:hypothetical protein
LAGRYGATRHNAEAVCVKDREAVGQGGPPAGSTEAELVSTPTPGPRTAMRRSDRAVAAMARRTPWILRGVARLAPATGRR